MAHVNGADVFAVGTVSTHGQRARKRSRFCAALLPSRRDTALRASLQPIPADSCYQPHFHVHPLIASKYSSAVFRGYLRRHIRQSEKRVAPSVLIETGRNLSSRLVGRERGAMSLIQSAIAATRTNVIGGRSASLSHCLAV